jgi:hypothetical protein
MRLFKLGMAVTLAGCGLMSGVAVAATARASEFSSVAVEGRSMRADALLDGRAEYFASNLVPDFKDAHGITQSERTHLAFAAPPLRPALGASRIGSTSSFSPQATEQPPSLWLMGSMILFLIAYQLRRKHRLLRPHRFHEL